MNDNQSDNFFDVCGSFNNAMLVTQSSDGTLQARPMVIAKFEDSGDLWFATDADSGKVDEVLAVPKVCVTMAGYGKYASITGMAEVIRDQSIVERLWSELWRVWFPDGPDDPRIVLIKVHASEGEYWSNAGTNRLKYLFDAAKAYAIGQRPSDISDAQHGHVSL